MLKIVIPEREQWDEEKEVFIHTDKQVLQLEHSLVSISKWEAKWRKPFLKNNDEKLSPEEFKDYVKCMTLTQNVKPEVYDSLTSDNTREISEYINSPMTATWFSEREKKSRINKQVITSELVYFWMISFQIPFECQKWHFNRLMTLIKICNESREDPEKNKMSKRELMSRNRSLNEARKAKYHTRG